MQKPTGIYELPIQEKYMLSLKEAGIYFNIGIKKMRRMAELNEGGFALFNGNRWIICRPKLEEYLLKLMKSPDGDLGGKYAAGVKTQVLCYDGNIIGCIVS